VEVIPALALQPPAAHLLLKGELDGFAARLLRPRIDEGIENGCVFFTVDASAVTFLDAGGIGTLVWLVNRVAPFGGTVTVVAASRPVRRVVALTGLEAVLGLDPHPISVPMPAACS
jgi:anti-sigma B factor antagonist